jgi:tRNA/tmRNA/rRNA uracil-C5-methylase (TrmA/RlmC/RlmD family)
MAGRDDGDGRDSAPRESLEVGAVLSLVTGSSLAQGGEAIARAPDGRVVFVRGGAPDERVEARLTQVKRRFLRAEVERVARPGPTRVEPPCRHYHACGGCDLMHVDPDAQGELLLAAGLEVLARVGGVARRREDVRFWRGDALGARTRARLAVRGGVVGFRARRSHEVVRIDRCLALHPRLDAAREALAELASGRAVDGVEEVELATDGHEVAIHLSSALEPLAGALRAKGFRVLAPGDRPEGGELTVRDAAGEMVLRPGVFSQASLQGNAALLEAVADELPRRGRFAVELHAGSGNFTRLLPARFARVLAVERSAEAVALGRRATGAAVEWRARGALAGWREATRSQAPDVLLVDPPRAGLEPGLAEAIGERPPAMMLYVSCDVGTLARDLRRLTAAGLRVTTVRALDLYPQTAHLEWCVTLTR